MSSLQRPPPASPPPRPPHPHSHPRPPSPPLGIVCPDREVLSLETACPSWWDLVD